MSSPFRLARFLYARVRTRVFDLAFCVLSDTIDRVDRCHYFGSTLLKGAQHGSSSSEQASECWQVSAPSGPDEGRELGKAESWWFSPVDAVQPAVACLPGP